MDDVSTGELETQVYRQLERVVDPEVGMDIVKLGLVYDVAITTGDVAVTMTLTTPGCPLGQAMTQGAQRAVQELPWVQSVDVRLVWDPPWNPAMIR